MTIAIPLLVPSVAGDPVPAAIGRYIAQLAGEDPEHAAESFAEDALFAAAPASGAETQPRIETNGRKAIAERLGGAARISEIQLCVVDGAHCLVEGVDRSSVGGPETRTFVASAALSDGGLIERWLEYSCHGARRAIPTDADESGAGDALTIVHRYFDALDGGEFEDAAACFSPNMLYSHPPYRHTGIDNPDRVEFWTRPELIAAFKRRGKQTFGHEILTCVQRGRHAILEGSVFDLPNGGNGSFISSLSLDADDCIARYVSFYCEPSVRQR